MMAKYPGYRTMTAAQRHNARQERIWETCRALGTPPISVEFNDRLNAAAKAGEQEAIEREARFNKIS